MANSETQISVQSVDNRGTQAYNRIRDSLLMTPPFEIPKDSDAYTVYGHFLDEIMENTLREFSEYYPVVEEVSFTTEENENTINLYEKLHYNFMDFILFMEHNQYSNFRNYLRNEYYYNYNVYPSINLNRGSLISVIARNDYKHIIDEWTKKKVEKIIYNDTTIKVIPNTTYDVIYRRYRNSNELTPFHIKRFRDLVRVNLEIDIYSSSIQTSENGIKKVSISGISVEFNTVFRIENYKTILEEKKTNLIETFTNLYDEI